MNLSKRLKEFCEFDADKTACDHGSVAEYPTDLIKGAEIEHARLKPVLDALVECVAAMKLSLEFHACETYHLPPTGIPLDMALSNLERLLNEMEKK